MVIRAQRQPPYLDIVKYYQACLQQYGDTARGADWPNEADREKRYSVMLDSMPMESAQTPVLLDFGCGTGELLHYANYVRRQAIRYKGVDLSPLAIQLAQAKFPNAEFHLLDVLTAPHGDLMRLQADYCVMNGVFTVKNGLSNDEMWAFMTALIRKLWPLIHKGVAFNVMSKQVDWERPDLFHVSLDRMADFLHKLAGRRVTFRADYGLYEYTCYVGKEAPSS